MILNARTRPLPGEQKASNRVASFCYTLFLSATVVGIIGCGFLTHYLRDARAHAEPTTCSVQAVVSTTCRPKGTTGGSSCGFITIVPFNSSALPCSSFSNGTLPVDIDVDEPTVYRVGDSLPCFYDPRDCQTWPFLNRPPIWPMAIVFPLLSVMLLLLAVFGYDEMCGPKSGYVAIDNTTNA